MTLPGTQWIPSNGTGSNKEISQGNAAMEQTKHNDEVGGALAEAMWLLEMWLSCPSTSSGLPVSAEEIGWTAHDLIQAARTKYAGDVECEISPHSKAVIRRMREIDSETLNEWMNEVPLQCSATTKSGDRCKNNVHGGAGQQNLEDYAALRGGYCSTHGGE